MKSYSIFISSADSYSDIWPVFFHFFKFYWPEYDGIIYLNTESKDYKHEGLNIICTKVGKQGVFGKTFRSGLKLVKDDIILLIMIDYLFMDKVRVDLIARYFDIFRNLDADALFLVHHNSLKINTLYEDVELVAPPAKDMFSYQIAFWKKESFYEMALPHESPWTSEWYGTKRANKMKMKIGCISSNFYMPISYDLAGCLHKGKWLQEAVEHLNKHHYKYNFLLRGFYSAQKQNFSYKVKMKWMFIKHGLMGSYWDLLRR